MTGLLCLKEPLPGMGRSILGDPQKYKEDYFQHFPGTCTCVLNCYFHADLKFWDFPQGLYFTNDVAYRDADGDYKIIGRMSDISLSNGDWISKDVPEIENAVV